MPHTRTRKWMLGAVALVPTRGYASYLLLVPICCFLGSNVDSAVFKDLFARPPFELLHVGGGLFCGGGLARDDGLSSADPRQVFSTAPAIAPSPGGNHTAVAVYPVLTRG